MSLRLGWFGGTFDPIHRAHLRMAEAFAAELALDQVRLIPAGQPYHRAQQPAASAQQRLEMVKLAVQDHPLLQVDGREVTRLRPAYTVETLEEIREELGQDVELWFLIGSDAFMGLPTWQRWQDLLKLANLAIALRPGFLPQSLPPPLHSLWQQAQQVDFSKRSTSGTIRPLTLPAIAVSATLIRQRLAQGLAVDEWIPPAPLAYIQAHGLYQAP